MSDDRYTPGGDAQVISEIARNHFGDFSRLFEFHGWPERGPDMMRKVQTRVVETYGSVRAFETYFAADADNDAVWTAGRSVLLTSFWGWGPETWGTVGWSNARGRARRDNLLKMLSDPFITVVYVTNGNPDPTLKGRIAGFYVVSHETGDRDQFTHPAHYDDYPNKWRHSLRALRAFTFLPEYRPRVEEVFPEIVPRRLTVAAMGEIVHDPEKVKRLRGIPYAEVPVFTSVETAIAPTNSEPSGTGMVHAGPASRSGYFVPEGTLHLPRELYILRLAGDTDAYVCQPKENTSIFKIGLSVSPELRREFLQKALPHGKFRWQVERTTRRDGHAPYKGFAAAVKGEYAMKLYLANNADHLGGEFYLATDDHIGAAWDAGRKAAMEVNGYGHAKR